MRTTLDIDEAVLQAARAIARDQGISLGNAITQLARAGLEGNSVTITTSGFPVFTTRPDAGPITLDLVNAHRDGD